MKTILENLLPAVVATIPLPATAGKTPPLNGNTYTTSTQNRSTIVTTPSGSRTYTRHR